MSGVFLLDWNRRGAPCFFLLEFFPLRIYLSVFAISRISPPGSKPKSASDDRDSAIAGLLQEQALGTLGPQWIRPAPPRLPVFDGEVKYSEMLYFHKYCP